jgi:hypothetical protein
MGNHCGLLETLRPTAVLRRSNNGAVQQQLNGLCVLCTIYTHKTLPDEVAGDGW